MSVFPSLSEPMRESLTKSQKETRMYTCSYTCKHTYTNVAQLNEQPQLHILTNIQMPETHHNNYNLQNDN